MKAWLSCAPLTPVPSRLIAESFPEGSMIVAFDTALPGPAVASVNVLPDQVSVVPTRFAA